MRILLLANNWVGWQVAQWLKDQPVEIVGLVIHPPHWRMHIEELLECIGLPPEQVFDGTRLGEPETLAAIAELKADMALSLFFGYLLKADFLRLFPQGVVNLHPALLPYNRGRYPNVWSIIDRTPAGATLHFIDEGVDTGDIIAQKEVPVLSVDTGKTLYHKLERACVELFQETWPSLQSGTAPRLSQVPGEGTHHRANDVGAMDEIDLDRPYTARDLIDLLRARTFPPHTGAYFMDNGRKVHLRLELSYEELPHDRGESHGS